MHWFVCMCIHASLFCNVMKKKDINTDEREIEEERGYPASTAKKKKKNKFE